MNHLQIKSIRKILFLETSIKRGGVTAIYGANASGKTAVYKALTMALGILRSFNIRQINDQIPTVPFKFNTESVSAPSRFEFTFIAGDGKKYIYGYSADRYKVREEYLYRFNTSRSAWIFDRKGTEYKFARSEKRFLDPLVRMNSENKLFLATATAWNVESTAIPYRWLAEGIDTYTNDENLTSIALCRYANSNALKQ